MAGLSDILEVARRSIAVQRAAIETTGHNIANAGTPGYSRQRVDLAATMPIRTSFGLLGSGVTASHIGRIRESLIDAQVRSVNDSLGQAETQHRILSRIEAVVNEPSDNGLSTALGKFFDSFQNLALHPEDSAFRTAVIQQATLMSQSFHQLTANMKQAQSDLMTDIQGQVKDINKLAKDISDLDNQIVNAASEGLDPSDMKDQRDQKLDQLSTLAQVSVAEDEKGSLLVSVGGAVIASRSGAVELKASFEGKQVRITSSDSGREVRMVSGKLGAMTGLYNQTIPGYMVQIDEMASTVISKVNEIHKSGYGLGTPPSTGQKFFTGTTALDIAVDSALMGSTDYIAASEDGKSGNNKTALAIADLKGQLLMKGNSVSISQYYNDFVSTLGTAINAADSTATTQGLIQQQLDAQRNSISGVSIDEEMTNMIKYQRAFDASAKVVSSVNELFLTILNMVHS